MNQYGLNRSLYLPTDSTHGRLLKADLERQLVRRGLTHLSHLLSPLPPTGPSYSPWLSRDEAIFTMGSKRIGDAVSSLIELIPHEWTKLVRLKMREPFQCQDWIIRRSHAHMKSPWYIYKVIEVLNNKMHCQRYGLSQTGAPFLFVMLLGPLKYLPNHK